MTTTITYRTVFHDYSLEIYEEPFQRTDHSSEVTFILVIVIQPHRILYVVHCTETFALANDPRSIPTKFSHVAANSKQQTQMDAEGSYVRAGFAFQPYDS